MQEARRFFIGRYLLLALGVCFGILPAATMAAPAADYGQFGPYDYYNPPKGALALVESAHMGPIIAEAKYRGRWCEYYDNLDYTLRAFPNHPLALTLMAEYLDSRSPCGREPAPAPRGRSPLELAAAIESGAWRERNADYYFEKGIEYKPKDAPKSVVKRPETRILYGKFLYERKRLNSALTQFTEAVKLDPSAAEAYYYLGLVHFDKNNPQAAKTYIDKARTLGQPPKELKQKLISVGQWRGDG